MSISLEEIVKNISENRCVVLLGPNAAKNVKGERMQTGLLHYLKDRELDIEEDIDNLFKCNRKTKTRAQPFIKDYYRKNCETNEFHKQLALIPVHLIISITPDLLMREAYDDYGISYEYKYYVSNTSIEKLGEPTLSKPLLYNLFGSIEEEQSLVLTHEDLIKYLFSIIGAHKLPHELMKAVQGAQYFIFLGFDFDKWYLKVLLNLFLNENTFSFATEGEITTNEKIKVFYKDNYGFEFVNTDIAGYVNSLYEECQNQNILREIRVITEPSIKEEVENMIKEGEIEEALDTLADFIEGLDESTLSQTGDGKDELLVEVNNHSAKLRRNERNYRKGAMTEEAANVERTRIISAIQHIVRELTA